MSQQYTVATIFIIYAAVAIFQPDLLARYQKWANQKILGAKFEAGARTLTFYRFMGFIFAIFALLLLFGVIK